MDKQFTVLAVTAASIGFIHTLIGPDHYLPLLMYPAAKSSLYGIFYITAIFGAVTIATMMTIVMVSLKGINLLPLGKFERYIHATAGGTICLSGLAIQVLGL